MGDLVLAIDQGTTGTTALLVTQTLEVLGKVNVEFPNHYPEPGHVEHDADQIWDSVRAAVTGVLERTGASADRIAAIGVTNQRETSLFWDRATGRPIHRALVWQDRRTADRCRALRDDGREALFKERTGLVLDPYFSGTKAEWTLDHVPGARERAERGELAFGTIDTWVAYKLAGVHVTDPSNASRTLLYDLNRMRWDEELCALLRVPTAALPEVAPSSQIYGHTRSVGFLPDGIPVAGLIGDQQGALFGQACFSKGMAKCTYGTGAFILMNTGAAPVGSDHGMLTTVGWKVGDQVVYALEGSAFVAGAAVQWLRDGLGLVKHAAEIEALAASVPDSGGVVFVPALTGLGAPHWRPDARGLVSGITRGTTAAHLARAALDGIVLQIDDILRAMSADLGAPLAELRVDGGASANDLLMQRQADLLEVQCVRPTIVETTALGSGLLAGLAVGLWSTTDEVARAWHEDRRFLPAGNAEELARTRRLWQEAVARA
ncbi:MAG: glycerol kinase GlpK [Alphaproteobacteria bacterium]|nr:glycerol kinase GlpK [Alphaproteobacteria bacterium]MCB9698451.1 glycerol kinase GlpK [Alphaproteobacteria bacterium]